MATGCKTDLKQTKIEINITVASARSFRNAIAGHLMRGSCSYHVHICSCSNILEGKYEGKWAKGQPEELGWRITETGQALKTMDK